MEFDYEKCVKGFKYLDTCADLLPPDAPVDHPHLMDTTNFNEDTPRGKLRVADGIATVLFNFDPEALRSFLNLEQPEFEFLRHEDSPSMNDLYIGRKGRVVMCGYFDAHPGNIIEWTLRCTYTITDSCSWLPKEGIMYGVSTSGFWGRLQHVNWDSNVEDVTDGKIVKRHGRDMATNMLVMQKWKEGTGIKMTVSDVLSS